MAKQTNQYLPTGVFSAAQKIVNATGAVSGEPGGSVSNLVTIVSAQSEDIIIQSLLVASTDTSARTLNLYVNDGTNDWLLCAVTIPLASGSASAGTTANVDLFMSQYFLGLPFDQSGKPILPLKAGWTLKAGVQVAVTSGKTIAIAAIGQAF